jgi:hypothetical protein
MKCSPTKTAPEQYEFNFCQTGELTPPPPLEKRILCASVPEQKTQRLWAVCFADRPEGPNRFKIRR